MGYLIERQHADEEADHEERFRESVFAASVASNIPELYEEMYGVKEITPEEEGELEWFVPESEADLEDLEDMLRGMPGFEKLG